MSNSDKCMRLARITPAILVLTIGLASSACSRAPSLPDAGSEDYRNLITAFYVGLASLQTGEDNRAQTRLTEATRLAPAEPASWANLGLLAARHQDLDLAYEHVQKARSLAPSNSRIEVLLGSIESRRGNLPAAIGHFKNAGDLDPTNLRALYSLATETERQSSGTSDGDAQDVLVRILQLQPDNFAVLLDIARLAAKLGNREALNRSLAVLESKSASWPPEAKQQLTTLQQAAAGSDLRSAAVQVAFLRNVLAPSGEFRRDLNAVMTPVEFVGEPFTNLIALPSPSSQPATPDSAMTFSIENIPGIDSGKDYTALIIPFDSETSPAQGFYGAGALRIPGAEIRFAKANAQGGKVVAFDFNYDFKADVVAVSDEGVRFYRRDSITSFTDVTQATALPDRVLRARYNFVQVFDFDLDGDLDVFAGPAVATAPPVVLRNNGNGTFKDLYPFPRLRSVRQLASADFDADGDPDLAVVDASGFLVLVNERLGQYRERQPLQALTDVVAVAVGDINNDSTMDFMLLNRGGQILRLVDNRPDTGAGVVEIDRVNITAGAEIYLRIADLDNNGSLDAVAGNAVLLSDGQGKFLPINIPADVRVQEIMDVNNDGRLDLVGMQSSGGGRPVQLINRGARNYHYQKIRTRAAQATGDQRINSFGIGGEIEIRSGLLTQKQFITSPVLHFGLGENTQSDVARIVWPNGSVQAEFELKSDQSVLAEQRLKGSCPMLFAWDGKEIRYVKDTAPWSPALGLRINDQVTAGIYQTEEWFRIRGDQLAPRDGFYDLRVTAELWEVYYVDHYSMMVVDHPKDTEVFSDERFAVPPPPLKLYATEAAKAFVKASDDRNQDVTDLVRTLDERYLSSFGKGQYQGVTRDHWVELELPPAAPGDRQLYLIGHGFLHPTDGSINIAYSQTNNPPPQGLTIETPDAHGQWSVARSGLGFPAGKLKTVVLDLNYVFRPGAPRKLRLRTNMEIYWDKLEWAEGVPATVLKTQRIELSSAELLWRGFSRFTQADETSPELPDYNQLEATTPQWRDLIGFYTRHGEVSELLKNIEGRIVIINAGDELRLKFPAVPPPPDGWVRDYVMIGDGWIKDGDLNSTFSKTVLPLPYRGMKDYDTAPGRLEDDPGYRQHPQDWQTYHTRYVTPEFFQSALRN
jgi:Tfp pilus assembly protein PilF